MMANNLNYLILTAKVIVGSNSFSMNAESNIYKRPAARVTGMSSRQQVLYLLQKTQKEANWDMENDSDFQDDGNPL